MGISKALYPASLHVCVCLRLSDKPLVCGWLGYLHANKLPEAGVCVCVYVCTPTRFISRTPVPPLTARQTHEQGTQQNPWGPAEVHWGQWSKCTWVQATWHNKLWSCSFRAVSPFPVGLTQVSGTHPDAVPKTHSSVLLELLAHRLYEWTMA